MEVAPFFVDFHHFLSIFTIFYRFSRFTHFCRNSHFVAIYALFPQFFLAKIAFSATSHVFCMYGLGSLLSMRSFAIEKAPSPLPALYATDLRPKEVVISFPFDIPLQDIIIYWCFLQDFAVCKHCQSDFSRY